MKIKNYDIANGDGVRTSLFVSGCDLHCRGCFNKESWDLNAGQFFSRKVKKELLKNLEPDYIKGLSLLGGDPFNPNNVKDIAFLVEDTKRLFPDKTIWAWSGYTLDELLERKDQYTKKILDNIDVLVDGQFIEEEKDLSLRFRGSRNQRLIYFVK